MLPQCRFYSSPFPDVEDTVMVNVKKIRAHGVWVLLKEYGNKEGLLLLSELSRRRIRSVDKLITVGRSECVVVLKADKDTGYIDLSKRRVYAKDLLQCEERYAKAKLVDSILRQMAKQLRYYEIEQLEDLYNRTAWHFERKEKRKAAIFDVFKKAIRDPTVLDECYITEDIKEKLIESSRNAFEKSEAKVKADIEVSCFAYDGIDAVKEALGEGTKCSTDALPIKITVISSPHYVVTCTSYDRKEGLAALQTCLDEIKTAIEKRGGNFAIKKRDEIDHDKELRNSLKILNLDARENID